MVSIQVNANDTLQFLADAASRSRHAASAWRVCAMRLRQDILRNFQQGGWYPAKWAPNKRGGQTLVDLCGLRNSMHAASGEDYAKAGTDVKYAAVHQFGATIHAKSAKYLRFKCGDRWASKKSVTIPARPFLPIDPAGNLHPETMTFVVNTLANHILKHGAA